MAKVAGIGEVIPIHQNYVLRSFHQNKSSIPVLSFDFFVPVSTYNARSNALGSLPPVCSIVFCHQARRFLPMLTYSFSRSTQTIVSQPAINAPIASLMTPAKGMRIFLGLSSFGGSSKVAKWAQRSSGFKVGCVLRTLTTPRL